jgi:hypothetical protein
LGNGYKVTLLNSTNSSGMLMFGNVGDPQLFIL